MLSTLVKHSIWGVCLLGLWGCMSLQTVNVEVLKPAQTALPPSIKSVALVNSAFTNSQVSFSNSEQKSLFAFDTLMSQSTIFKLATILSQSPRFDTAVVVPNLVYRQPQQLLRSLPAPMVATIARQQTADGVLSLEAFSLIDTVLSIHYQFESGILSQQNFAVLASGLWRLYEARTGALVYTKVITDTLFLGQFESSSIYLQYISQSQSRLQLANQAADGLAYQLADDIAPYWQTESRNMLIISTDSIVQGARMAYLGKWTEAALFWQPLTTNSSAKIAAVASHNMALVCEVAGKYTLAIEWINKAIRLKPNNVSIGYKTQLENRLNEAELLNQQFGQSNY